ASFCGLCPGVGAFDQFVELPGAVTVGVMGKDAGLSATGNGAGAAGIKPIEMIRHLASVSRDQHLGARLQEMINAVPGVGDEASAGPDRLEHAGRRREAVSCHAVAIDIEGCESGGEESVVLAGSDMARSADVGWHVLRFPTRAAENETSRGQAARHLDEELLDAPLPIRQAVGE